MKRIFDCLTFIMILVLCLSMLTACGGNSQSAGSGTSAVTEASADAQTLTPTVAETETSQDSDDDAGSGTSKGFSNVDLEMPTVETYTAKKYNSGFSVQELEPITLDIPSAGTRSYTSFTYDESTGTATMNSSVLFSSNSYELSDEGKDVLKQFLDQYVDIVLSDENKDAVKKIIIEGHTDTEGTHEYNQTLSEKRANTVKDYCLQIHPELKKYLEAKGYSYDNPVLKDDGSVDMDASRRVVFRVDTGE